MTSERLRLEAYKRIAAIGSDADIGAVRDELVDRYGRPPQEVENLLEVARFRIRARRAGLTDVTLQGQNIKFAPGGAEGVAAGPARPAVPEGAAQAGGRTLLVPVPKTRPLGGQPLRDLDLLKWCGDLVEAMFLEPVRVELSGVCRRKGTHVKSTRVRVALAVAAAGVALTACSHPGGRCRGRRGQGADHVRRAGQERPGVRGGAGARPTITAAQLQCPSVSPAARAAPELASASAAAGRRRARASRSPTREIDDVAQRARAAADGPSTLLSKGVAPSADPRGYLRGAARLSKVLAEYGGDRSRPGRPSRRPR